MRFRDRFEDRGAELQRLRQSADAALRRADQGWAGVPAVAPDDQVGLFVLRLARKPSFGDGAGLSVVQRRGNGGWLRVIRWEGAHDERRLMEPLVGVREGFHPHPTLEHRDVQLDDAAISGFVADVGTIAVAVEPIVGVLDGIPCAIELVAYRLRLEREWHEDLVSPELDALLRRVVKRASAFVPEAEGWFSSGAFSVGL